MRQYYKIKNQNKGISRQIRASTVYITMISSLNGPPLARDRALLYIYNLVYLLHDNKSLIFKLVLRPGLGCSLTLAARRMDEIPLFSSFSKACLGLVAM